MPPFAISTGRPAPAVALCLAFSLTCALTGAGADAASLAPAACKGTIYLTFDTGSQSQAELIADTLRRHRIQATFFLANEKTTRGDYSLDPSWAAYWKARVAEGHAFGSHTFDHVYLQRKSEAQESAQGLIEVKPQFGADAGKNMTWSAAQFCDEIKRVDQRFEELTGRHLDPLWRAPGGRVSARSLAAGTACGYAHVAWAKAGYSGDELSSATYPNETLLRQSLANLRDGDIFIAHMGIWSRQAPWAPANLDRLITGLEQKGFCFATLRAHPDYAARFAPAGAPRP